MTETARQRSKSIRATELSTAPAARACWEGFAHYISAGKHHQLEDVIQERPTRGPIASVALNA
jgi:hypothetical protein